MCSCAFPCYRDWHDIDSSLEDPICTKWLWWLTDCLHLAVAARLFPPSTCEQKYRNIFFFYKLMLNNSTGSVICRISDDMKLTDLELVRLANNIQELLYNASDVCHDRSVKFLMARAKVSSLGQTAVGVSSLMRIYSQVTGLMRESSEMAFSVEIK